MRAGNRLLAPGANVQHGRAVAGGGDWWDYSGVVAAYDAKNASSLANSYVNLANPGTYDAAPGVAPTWAGGTGWTFDGSTQWLPTGIDISDASAYTILVSFKNSLSSLGFIVGSKSFFGIQPYRGAGQVGYWSGGFLLISPQLANGVLGIAGNTAYRDGVAETGTISTSGSFTNFSIGAAGHTTTPSNFAAADVESVWIGSSTLSGTDVAALSTAMAAL